MLLSKKSVFFSGIMIFCLLFVAACGGSGDNTTNSSPSPNNNEQNAPTEQNAPKEEETIVLRGLSAWDENNVYTVGFHIFKKIIEEKSNGRVKIEFLGGPETVPAFNQGDAIRTGTADFTFISTSYFSSFPEAVVMNFSELTPTEERESGALDFLNTFAKDRMNGIILGRADDLQYSLYLREPITSMEEIKNLRIRATTAYLAFLEAMGAQIISTPHGEIYTSLERGVIDGFALGVVGVTDLGVEKLIKAQIAPPYNRVDAVNIMNLDTYNELPDDIKQLLTEAMIETEKELEIVSEELIAKENEGLKNAGVEVITIADADEYKQLALDASWEWVLENVEAGEELQKYFRKQ